ncbi:unnamed protein product [Didymodactylos carnosus]|uniref:Uncharacterized protein n=1 Tax=Didymodactylos carnosus TaxID=1234261 RepID=A0A8S2CSI2_9BILA|nr:unnamed protein product [Didymodactylos carnosus]CAF3546045.1 unnamed protein product [Didymodactylos carnosus]
MKWLPAKYRELQSDFFGKRGISWRISVVTKKHNINAVDQEGQKSDGETGDTLDDNTAEGISNNFSQYQHTVFVHAFDQCTQDAETVRAIIQDVLQKIKVTDSHVKQAYIRSDNAGCYHSAETILSIPQISKNTGITILDFSDPQGCKAACDPEQFVNASRSYGGVKNVSVVECRLSPLDEKIKFKLPGITSFNNFEFDASSIRVHRAWQIGDGEKLLKKDLLGQTPKISIVDCVKSPYCNDWSNSKETTRLEASKEEIENANDKPSNTIVYECNQEGCTQAFIRYQNFINRETWYKGGKIEFN